MQNFKRFTAVALAATMIVGGSIAAFAEETVTTGTTIGSGTSEGHVDKHVVKVILPTIADGSTPFAYTMDVERLIQGTSNAKYSGATFPAAASDTGVYFLSSTNTYTNKSEELTVTSESSAAVKLIVDVEVESHDTDITLVDTAPATDVTEPQLYLALTVGDTTKAVKKDEKVSVEVDIAGVPDNFKTTVENGEYVYSPLGSTDSGFTAWNTSKISMSGAASKASAEGLTAPTLKVTWSWVDPEAGLSVSPTSLSSSVTNVTISGIADGATLTNVKFLKADNSTVAMTSGTHYSFTASTGKFTVLKSALLGSSYVGSKFVLTFSDDTTVEIPVVAAE